MLGTSGEPDALKGARPVRRGVDGKGPQTWDLAGCLPYTVALGALALRHAVAGHQVLMLDPVGKAGRVIEAVGPHGGVLIPIDDQASINPLDVLSPDMKRQLGHVARKLTMILGQVSATDGELAFTPRPVTNLEMGALDRALQHPTLYGDRGARLATLTTATAPRLETLVTVLRGMQTDAARGLAAEIEARALDSFAQVYNTPTTMRWDFDHDVIAYDFQHANPELLPLIYDHGFAAINRYVRDPARLRRQQKLLVQIDEYGFMAQIPALHVEVARATKTWRNFGGGLWSADQNAQTYMGGSTDASAFAKLTTNNTQIKLFGRQEGDDLAMLEAAYGHLLSAGDLRALSTAGAGEFLGIFGNEVYHLHIQLTDQEMPYFIRAH